MNYHNYAISATPSLLPYCLYDPHLRRHPPRPPASGEALSISGSQLPVAKAGRERVAAKRMQLREAATERSESRLSFSDRGGDGDARAEAEQTDTKTRGSDASVSAAGPRVIVVRVFAIRVPYVKGNGI